MKIYENLTNYYTSNVKTFNIIFTSCIIIIYNSHVINKLYGVVVVGRSLESWWRQPTFRCVYADHLSL